MPAIPYRLAKVSPSMIRSVFAELKANGYSDHQILALSAGLMEQASEAIREVSETAPAQEAAELCAAGLPHQI